MRKTPSTTCVARRERTPAVEREAGRGAPPTRGGGGGGGGPWGPRFGVRGGPRCAAGARDRGQTSAVCVGVPGPAPARPRPAPRRALLPDAPPPRGPPP